MAVLPLGLGGISLWLGWVVTRPDPIIGGLSLLAGGLLAAFGQLASWRTRLAERNKTSEGIGRRAIDEAVAHTLVASMLSLAVAVLMVIISNLSPTDPSSEVSPSSLLVLQGLTALAIAAAALVVLLFVITINLLWDGYERMRDVGTGGAAAGTAPKPESRAG